MNVTPMIDILLVLIIIFLMITPVDKGLQTQIPQPVDANPAPPPERTVVIQLLQGKPDELPKLKINQQTVEWKNLNGMLQTIFAARSEKVAFVQGDPGIDFQNVATVIDIAHGAGVDHIGLLTPATKPR